MFNFVRKLQNYANNEDKGIGLDNGAGGSADSLFKIRGLQIPSNGI